ncbi:NAD-dependent epimerase/dehydratase family protein [Seonamhaeicola marinus]|uniref:NAD-dependent epimerase/dehydratase family protein n=1 Tax=Seonamhaeicola marinus TaxID=1912246 RepID=A0A5D0HID6_9FLAO|nr:NAD-dependent epimerase/dehydratase family protein [Seonamhaeicola marinus]TYA70039.1 NAD-dependent epimerase/dehydratase family protein [Seonamhaeicola marinus]
MILVTGGTGLVGAHLLYKLASKGEKVRAIFRNEKKLENIKSVFSCYTNNYSDIYNGIEFVKGDILDIPSLVHAFKDVEYVYHCAAFVSFEPDKYVLSRKTNIEGTANIVNFCSSNNVKKLCHVSSIAALGNNTSNAPINEKNVWNPEDDHSIYAITKYGAEMEVWRGTQEGLDAVIVNPGVILGAGIWRYGSGNIFKRAHKGFKYYTSGSVGLVNVDDVTEIMIKLIKSDLKNERYILVAQDWSYKQFLQHLAESVNMSPPKRQASKFLLTISWKLDWLKTKLTGKRRVLTRHIADALTNNNSYDNSKITNALDYSFRPIDKTIKDIGSNYLKQAQ